MYLYYEALKDSDRMRVLYGIRFEKERAISFSSYRMAILMSQSRLSLLTLIKKSLWFYLIVYLIERWEYWDVSWEKHC
jgi:hypothetical protein